MNCRAMEFFPASPAKSPISSLSPANRPQRFNLNAVTTMAVRNGILLALACCAFGCGRGTPPTADGPNPNPQSADPANIVAATFAATEFVVAAKAGTATAVSLTDEFKKVIGEPITPGEREKGFSDPAATDWLKVLGPRLKSGQLRPILAGKEVALFDLDAGLLRLVKIDGKWKVDWFHAGRPAGAANFNEDRAASKNFAIAAFLDPLFTNNFELSEAALTLDAKKSLAPALGGDARGYNRGTLRGKLKSILNGATGYTVVMTGDKATVTLTGSTEKKLTLSLSVGARPEIWLVSGVD